MKSNILTCVYLLFSVLVYSNSKQKLVQKDSILLNDLKKKYDLTKKNKDFNKALIYADSILLFFKKNNDVEKIALSYNRLGYIYYKQKKYNRAYEMYVEAKKNYSILNDNLNVAKRLLALAKIESDFELYYKSDSTATTALSFLNIEDDKDVRASVYNCLGINARNTNRYDLAEKNYINAIKIVKDSTKRIRYINNLAVYYRYKKEYKKSKKLYNSILKSNFYHKIPLSLKGIVLDNLAYVKFLLNELDNDNEFLTAQKIKSKKGLVANYSYLSDFYSKRDKRKSLDYAFKMYKLTKKINLPVDREKAIRKIIPLCEVDDIRKYFKEINILRDSLQFEMKRSRNKLVSTIYDFKNEEKQKLIFEKKAIQSEKQKQLWIYIGSLSLVTLIAYFFYKRQKTKKEKIIEVYKTETRLAKKIHDELANDVYLAMNKIQSNATIESTDLLADLDKIYKQTRDISHENSPVITGEKFQEFLQQLFIDFTTDTCKIINKGLSEIQVNSIVKEKQIILYRVLQELLVNMKKHSKANLVVIAFDKEKEKIKVRYKDNGVGVQLIANKNGLNNMETRIKSIGGTITFDSEKQKGFQAKFQFKK